MKNFFSLLKDSSWFLNNFCFFWKGNQIFVNILILSRLFYLSRNYCFNERIFFCSIFRKRINSNNPWFRSRFRIRRKMNIRLLSLLLMSFGRRINNLNVVIINLNIHGCFILCKIEWIFEEIIFPTISIFIIESASILIKNMFYLFCCWSYFWIVVQTRSYYFSKYFMTSLVNIILFTHL